MKLGFRNSQQIVQTTFDPEEEARRRLDDQYDVIKFMCEVDSGIRREIGSDFTLAKLEERQKEFITQQTKIAFVLKQTVPEKTKGRNIFDLMMVENYMIAILNRNVDKNTLLKVISGAREAVEQETPERVGMIEGIKNRLRKKKPEQE